MSIPASFRGVLARDGFEGLYVHPSLEAEALDCGGHGLLREIDGLLETLSPYSEERDAFSTALLGASEVLKVDPEGRVILEEARNRVRDLRKQLSARHAASAPHPRGARE